MIRFVVLSLITIAAAYLLYVFPVLAVLSLFRGSEIFGLSALPPTILVFLLLRLYLATSITNKALKAFVYYGMGIGFLSGLVLSPVLLVTWLLRLDGQIPGSVAVLAIGILTAMSIRNANNIVIRELTVVSDRVGSPTRLAFISDVHIGSNPPSHLQKICDQLSGFDIHGLLIGGDLFDSSDFRLEEIGALAGIGAGIYFITGNHEGYVRGHEVILARFPDLNIRVLDNDATDLHGINLIGVSDAQPSAAKIQAVDSLHHSDRFNIALVHQPSIWRKTERDVDLMLCGHTHNGQIYPFNLLVRLQFRHVYGLFTEAGTRLYVSSGAGCWGPRMRLGSRNEIVIIDLQPR